MAGIGFELRKLLRKETFISEVQAYLYSMVISSGPWLLSVFCLAALGVYFSRRLETTDQMLFRATIVYCYAFSLIVTGPIQLVASRFLSDRLYAKETQGTLPAFITSLALIFPLQAGLAWWFLTGVEAGLAYKILAGVLYLTISGVWLGMVFLSVAKDYHSIVAAFIGGSCLSLLASIWLGRLMGLNGLMAGFLAGQALIFLILTYRMVVESEVVGCLSKGLISYFYRHWMLALIGLVLNLGIWIDKMIFWWSDEAHVINGPISSHQIYEISTFFAYLTIVPSLAYFLVKVEVDFYDRYHSFFQSITLKQPYGSIHEIKIKMTRTLSEALRTLLIIQGLATGLGLYLAPWLIETLNLSGLCLGIMRVAMIGAFLQCLFQLETIILFYFDLRREALALSLFFLCANALLSWTSLKLGFPYYGYGYTYAALASLLMGALLLEWGLRNLEYLVFAKQPVV
ncbi:MAG: exopolysaccharide Pel transporter PelG [Deltaproteobacteria bacterium]|nr:exopolysaccharide Pel transporter PelG [Deltaproteobacteria bacterium]